MSLDMSKVIAAKQQLQAALSRGGGGSSVKFFNLANGKNKIRILPPWTSEGIFAGVAWREVHQHWGVNDDHKAPILCPAKTVGVGGDCPICAFLEELKTHEDDPVAMEMVNRMKAKRAFLMQIIDLASPTYSVQDVAEWAKKSPDKEAPFAAGDPKIQVFPAPISVMDSILALIGETQTDITDLKKGVDLIIDRQYNKSNPMLTKYAVTPAAFQASAAPISEENFEKFKIALDTVGRVYEYNKLAQLLAEGAGAGMTSAPKLTSGQKSAKALPATSVDKAFAVEEDEDDDIPPETHLPAASNELAALQAQMNAALNAALNKAKK